MLNLKCVWWWLYNKQHLSNIWSWIPGKVGQQWRWVEKNVLYVCEIQSNFFFCHNTSIFFVKTELQHIWLQLLVAVFFFFCNFYFLFLQIVLQFFKLNTYLIKSSKNTHIWLQFVANILLWSFREGSCLKSINNTKYNRNTNTHTHHTQANTQNRKYSQLHKLFKKAHMSHKYLFALKGVLIFCWVINTLHNVIA